MCWLLKFLRLKLKQKILLGELCSEFVYWNKENKELQKELERRKTAVDNCYQGHYAYNVINRTKNTAMVVIMYYCVREAKDDPKYLICDTIQIERYRDNFKNKNELVTRVDKFDNVYVKKIRVGVLIS